MTSFSDGYIYICGFMDTGMRYIQMVNEQRSFTKAAEKLFISQPSLSAMVKKVETELGAAIFDRSTTPLELTEVGRVYLEHIQAVARSEALLNEKLWDIQSLNKGQVRIGGSNYILSNILPQVLQHIIPLYPGIRFELVEENSFRLNQMLTSGALDLVVDSSDMEDSSLTYHHLFQERILLAVPTPEQVDSILAPYQIPFSHLKEDRSRSFPCLPPALAAAALARPFILLKSENDMYQRAVAIFRHYKIQPQVLLQLDQLNTSLQYTAYGLGCSFVTDTLFRHGAAPDGISLYAPDAPSCRRKLCIVHKKGKYVSKADRLFIQTAQTIFSSRAHVDDGL